MITVNGKKLEVGDIVVFRCGGKAVVNCTDYITKDLINLKLENNDYSVTYMNNGVSTCSTVFDIVDIIKAPKKTIKYIYKAENPYMCTRDGLPEEVVLTQTI